MVEEPICPEMGVTVIVRLFPLPPSAMFSLGTRAELDEVAETVSDPADVSASVTENGTETIDASTVLIWSGISLITGAAAALWTVVMVSDQPLPIEPRSPGPSSTTYRDHAPFGESPLNADRGALDGPPGAGDGKLSRSPFSPGSTLVGRYVPAVILAVAEREELAASESVTVILFKGLPPPTSENITIFFPGGMRRRISIFAGEVWVSFLIFTVPFPTTPGIPKTLMLLGWAVPIGRPPV